MNAAMPNAHHVEKFIGVMLFRLLKSIIEAPAQEILTGLNLDRHSLPGMLCSLFNSALGLLS